jgi:hypothetical protein
MNSDLKVKLTELGLNDDQIGKLEAQGVIEPSDMASLSVEEISNITGLVLIPSKKVFEHFNPKAAASTTGNHAPDAVIPDGAQPSSAQVNSFANSLGIDAGMLTMFMMAGSSANAGVGMDISSMIPIAQIVAGYNPKVRSMFYMVMGQLEARLEAPIVIINEDGSVNKELTVEYIEGLEEGREVAENDVYFDKDGNPYQVIAVGVDAQSIYDADPLDSAHPLQKNGMGVGRINWNKVPLEVKQVAYYAVKTGEINPNDSAKMDMLRDKIKPGASRLIFSGMAPKAVSEFNEASRTGSLPTLRVMLSRAPRRKEVMPRRRALTGDKNL